jgi:hypothetical protein
MEAKELTREELEERKKRIWELQQKVLHSGFGNMSMQKARWLAMKMLCLA